MPFGQLTRRQRQLIKYPYGRNPRKRRRNMTARHVRRIVKNIGETKHKDTAFAAVSTAILGTGVVYPLSLLIGTDGEERDGLQVELNSIHLKGTIENTPDYTSEARFILFIAKDCRGVLPTVDGTGLLVADSVVSLRLWESRRRYTVLMDKRIILQSHITGYPSYRNINYYKKFKNIKTQFKDLGGTIASATLNHLFVAVIVDQIVARQPILDMNARLTYKDM